MAKIVVTDETYKELMEILDIALSLEMGGKLIREKVENILAAYATYGIEVPEKRKKRIIKQNSKSIVWTEPN